MVIARKHRRTGVQIRFRVALSIALAVSLHLVEDAQARLGEVVEGSEVALPEGMRLDRLVDADAVTVALGYLDDFTSVAQSLTDGVQWTSRVAKTA